MLIDQLKSIIENAACAQIMTIGNRKHSECPEEGGELQRNM
jgi:hypothetical protein